MLHPRPLYYVKFLVPSFVPTGNTSQPPQIPAGLKGFLEIPEDSSGLYYNFSDFELEEKNSVKYSGTLRTGMEFGRISAKLEYITF